MGKNTVGQKKLHTPEGTEGTLKSQPPIKKIKQQTVKGLRKK